jgi:hypothetical protein
MLEVHALSQTAWLGLSLRTTCFTTSQDFSGKNEMKQGPLSVNDFHVRELKNEDPFLLFDM